MWQTDGGTKQSTRRGGTSLTEDLQTERERCSLAYIYIFLHKAQTKKKNTSQSRNMFKPAVTTLKSSRMAGAFSHPGP